MHSRIRRALRELLGGAVGREGVRSVNGSGAPSAGSGGESGASSVAYWVGALAAVGARSHRIAGVAARTRSLALAVLTVGVTFSLAAGTAQAKLVPYGTLGSGQLCNPQGVAVDPASHGVQVADINYPDGASGCSGVAFGAPAGLFGFDSSGNVISPPSPFGAGSGIYTSLAVNPTDGLLYVHDWGFGSPKIETYDPSTGAQIGSPCSVSGSGFEQIASDAVGNVYVPNAPGNAVQELDSACNPVRTFTGSGAGALSGPTGVAVDPAGDVWVADAGNNRIEEFDPTGATVLATIPSPGVQALAVDASGHVFALVYNGADDCGQVNDYHNSADACAHVVEYSAAGAQLDDIGAGMIYESALRAFGGVNGQVAVDDATGIVYVTDPTKDGSNELVRLWGPAKPPVLDRELAEQVSASGATLGARIEPGGLDTSYRFDYGTSSAYGQTVPVPDADAGSGLQPRTVWATVSGLAPNTTYHYRVVVSNSLGSVTGPDQTFTTAAGGCPNDQFRTGASAGLPDCRAYEMVTPPNKDSGAPGPLTMGPGQLEGYQVAADGHAVTYGSQDTFPGSPTNGGSYLAVRGAGGWSSQNLIPPHSGQYDDRCPDKIGMIGYSADLSSGILMDGSHDSSTLPCGSDNPPLVPGEPASEQNLFLRDNANGSYQLVDVTPAGVTPAPSNLDAGSADLSHVVFDEQAQLTPDAPPAPGAGDLYEWTGGQVRLVAYVPTGGATACGADGPACTPVAGYSVALAGALPQIEHAVSADGSRIFFTAHGNLYERLNGTSTVQLDAPGPGAAGPGGHGNFQIASVDGSRVLFTDDASNGLTGDTVPGSGANLYSYDTSTGQLTDLTPQATVDAGQVLGAGEDASYVYFIAGGVLAPGGTAGAQNIYLYHDGQTTFVASPSNLGQPLGLFPPAPARASANGRFLAFTSTDSLTGYDTAGTCTDVAGPSLPNPVYAPGGHCNEIYLYDSSSGQLSCASCNPDGDAPYGGAVLAPPRGDLVNEFGSATWYDPNSVSDSGQVFFDTQDALLPADTNGHIEDVYEYRAGHLQLLSPGTTGDNAWFVNATPSGSDVFIVTSQQLLPQDGDTSPDLYDARVGGGFPYTPPPPPCSGDACRTGISAPPPPPNAGTVTFQGPGNAQPGAPQRITVRVHTVRGPVFRVTIKVPGRGRVTISGRGIRKVSRGVRKAGSYHLRVKLTQRERALLAHKRKLHLALRVAFRPAGGKTLIAHVRLTVKAKV